MGNDIPWPKTMEELSEYIQSMLTNSDNNFECMANAATATLRYIGFKRNSTWPEANAAARLVYQKTENLKCPFDIIEAKLLLHPDQLNNFIERFKNKYSKWASQEAKNQLETKDENLHPDIVEHLKLISNGKV